MKQLRPYAMALVGGFFYAIAINLFIVPLGLYSCGLMGIAQLIRSVLADILHLPLPSGFDIAGLFNLALNIPLFLLAYKSISRRFVVLTLLSVLAQTLGTMFIPIPTTPILNDVLASCLVGGVIGGYGIGMTLRGGGSGGGLDILGVYFLQKKGISVGSVSIAINAAVFICCAILFDVSTALYSILFTVVFSLVLDKWHYQNINMSVMIFTKNIDLQKIIMTELRRGDTYWDGAGAYTDAKTRILMCVINKYEAFEIRKIIAQHDPNAFVIFNEGNSIAGNFEKRI